ncbi:hypothetical protein ACRRTK_002240 [Alexandromys fortis]
MQAVEQEVFELHFKNKKGRPATSTAVVIPWKLQLPDFSRITITCVRAGHAQVKAIPPR